jgi:hypothetical protein
VRYTFCRNCGRKLIARLRDERGNLRVSIGFSGPASNIQLALPVVTGRGSILSLSPPVGGGGATTIFVNAAQPSDGDGSEGNPFRLPQSAMAVADPGDVISLEGTFTTPAHIGEATPQSLISDYLIHSSRSGTAANPIVIRAHPNGCLIQGNFTASQQRQLSIQMDGSWIRVQNLNMTQSILGAGQAASDIFFENCDVGFCSAPPGNFGLVRLFGDSSVGPRRIHVLNCNLHDQYSIVNGLNVDWTQATGAALHNFAGVFRQGVNVAGGAGGGELYVIGCTIRRVSALITNKYPGPASLTHVESGTFADALWSGRQGNDGSQPMTVVPGTCTYSNVGTCNVCWAQI